VVHVVCAAAPRPSTAHAQPCFKPNKRPSHCVCWKLLWCLYSLDWLGVRTWLARATARRASMNRNDAHAKSTDQMT